MTWFDGKELYTHRFSKNWISRDLHKFINEIMAKLPDSEIGVHITIEYQVCTDGEEVKL